MLIHHNMIKLYLYLPFFHALNSAKFLVVVCTHHLHRRTLDTLYWYIKCQDYAYVK